MRRNNRSRLVALLLIGALTGLSVSNAAADDVGAKKAPTPRAEMHQIFDVLADLLPRFAEERYRLPADPVAGDPASEKAASSAAKAAHKERAVIQEGLARLAAASGQLDVHASLRDADFGFFARSLATDIAEAKRRADLDRFDEAHFFVTVALQNCVACHSRLPKARDFPLAERLTLRIGIEDFPAPERALYQVATRDFGSALKTWEAHFTSSDFHPGYAETLGTLVEYLRIAIQVEQRPDRARNALSSIRMRPDLTPELSHLLDVWIADLAAEDALGLGVPSLEMARGLAASMASDDAPGARIARDTIASSHLIRFIDSARASGAADEEIAEAFYWLGIIGARSVDSFWRLETEFHLETAIRMTPGAPYARDAFARLADYIHLGYSGSMGLNLPPDVAERLTELRALVDAADDADS